MNPATGFWLNWLFISPSERRPRSRRRRHLRPRLRRLFHRLLANLSLGFLLVGCSTFGGSKIEVTDPYATLRTNDDPNHRLVAYRRMAVAPATDAAGREEAIQLLVNGLETERTPLAREAAAASLGKFVDPRGAEALRKLVATDKSPMVRQAAIRSLAYQGDVDSVDVLGKVATTDKEVDVRLAATEALAKLNVPAGNPHLLKCMKDSEVIVTQAARAGLQKSTAVDLGPSYDAWAAYFANPNDPAARPTSNVADKSDSGLIRRMFR